MKLKELHIKPVIDSKELVDILESCHETLEELYIAPFEIDLSSFKKVFKNLRTIFISGVTNKQNKTEKHSILKGAENLLFKCSSSLKTLILTTGTLDFSKLDQIDWKIERLMFVLNLPTSLPSMLNFLNRCSKLEILCSGKVILYC